MNDKIKYIKKISCKLFHELSRQPQPALTVENTSHPRPVKVLRMHKRMPLYRKHMHGIGWEVNAQLKLLVGA